MDHAFDGDFYTSNQFAALCPPCARSNSCHGKYTPWFKRSEAMRNGDKSQTTWLNGIYSWWTIAKLTITCLTVGLINVFFTTNMTGGVFTCRNDFNNTNPTNRIWCQEILKLENKLCELEVKKWHPCWSEESATKQLWNRWLGHLHHLPTQIWSIFSYFLKSRHYWWWDNI